MGVGSSPCASCKLLRRRCAKDCIFAPYFPPEDPLKFAIVHKIFGASNVSKMLQEVPIDQRADAVSSMVYEASARMQDPVYGCVGTIAFLQNEVSRLEIQLGAAQAEILTLQMRQQETSTTFPTTTTQMDQDEQNLMIFSNTDSSNSLHIFRATEDYYHMWT
ncbi:hypothetical protein IC582_026666 [Cucumis melo]|uniref:LOB domain-containing protein 12-like n=1 Tax=Cucumis melo TaxID=3656 RepID=A0A1S3CKM4_CUCME|nr:LOB domain-containing protein 12-like [Cucumis melo]